VAWWRLATGPWPEDWDVRRDGDHLVLRISCGKVGIVEEKIEPPEAGDALIWTASCPEECPGHVREELPLPAELVPFHGTLHPDCLLPGPGQTREDVVRALHRDAEVRRAWARVAAKMRRAPTQEEMQPAHEETPGAGPEMELRDGRTFRPPPAADPLAEELRNQIADGPGSCHPELPPDPPETARAGLLSKEEVGRIGARAAQDFEADTCMFPGCVATRLPLLTRCEEHRNRFCHERGCYRAPDPGSYALRLCTKHWRVREGLPKEVTHDSECLPGECTARCPEPRERCWGCTDPKCREPYCNLLHPCRNGHVWYREVYVGTWSRPPRLRCDRCGWKSPEPDIQHSGFSGVNHWSQP
jgi:hypothetical protein